MMSRLVIMIGAFCATNEVEAAFARYYAHQAYERGDVEDALATLGSIAMAHPDDWRAFFDLGTITLQRAMYDDAVRHFERVVQLKPDNAEAQERLRIARDRDVAEKKRQKMEQQQKQQGQQSSDPQQKSGEGQNSQQDRSQSSKSSQSSGDGSQREDQGHAEQHDRSQKDTPSDAAQDVREREKAQQSHGDNNAQRTAAHQNMQGKGSMQKVDSEMVQGRSSAHGPSKSQEMIAQSGPEGKDKGHAEAYWMTRADAADREAQRQIMIRATQRSKGGNRGGW